MYFYMYLLIVLLYFYVIENLQFFFSFLPILENSK